MTSPAQSSPTLPRRNLLLYSLIAAPLAFAGMPLYVHAPDFYATEYGVSLSVIGIVLLFLRVIDAIQDPVIGVLGDRFAHRRGLIVIIAAIALALGFSALFSPLVSSGLIVWFAVAMLVATTAFSVLMINLNTLGGLWSRDKEQKTRITSYRESFGLVGLLLAVMLPSILQQFMSVPNSFVILSVILMLLMAVGVFAFTRWMQHKSEESSENPVEKSQKPTAFWHVIKQLNAQQRRFFLIYAVSMLASSMPAILLLFFIRDRLDAEAYTGLFLLLYFISGAAAMPLWQKLTKIWCKHRAWLAATMLAILSFIWTYFLGEGDILFFSLICIGSGMAFGADLALPPSILADYIHEQETEDSASLQFGLFAFLTKSALALASAIAFPLLDFGGFEPGAENSPNALTTLSIAYAAIPCVIKCVAALLLWRQYISLKNKGKSNEIVDSHITGGSADA